MKHFIQQSLKLFGYRLVARARDPETALEVVFSHPIDAVIDVGANRGATCIEWLERFPAAHIYAFEPIPELVKTIQKRTAHSASRVTIFQIAASDQHGHVEFHVHTDHPSSSSMQAATPESKLALPFTAKTHEITVQTATLDSALSDKSFAAGFLKIDVQGHEMSVLKGAEKLLKSIKYILVEVNLQPLYENQPGFNDLTSFLGSHGFSFIGVAEQFHLSSGRPVFLDALFERQTIQ